MQKNATRSTDAEKKFVDQIRDNPRMLVDHTYIHATKGKNLPPFAFLAIVNSAAVIGLASNSAVTVILADTTIKLQACLDQCWNDHEQSSLEIILGTNSFWGGHMHNQQYSTNTIVDRVIAYGQNHDLELSRFKLIIQNESYFFSLISYVALYFIYQCVVGSIKNLFTMANVYRVAIALLFDYLFSSYFMSVSQMMHFQQIETIICFKDSAEPNKQTMPDLHIYYKQSHFFGQSFNVHRELREQALFKLVRTKIPDSDRRELKKYILSTNKTGSDNPRLQPYRLHSAMKKPQSNHR